MLCAAVASVAQRAVKATGPQGVASGCLCDVFSWQQNNSSTCSFDCGQAEMQARNDGSLACPNGTQSRAESQPPLMPHRTPTALLWTACLCPQGRRLLSPNSNSSSSSSNAHPGSLNSDSSSSSTAAAVAAAAKAAADLAVTAGVNVAAGTLDFFLTEWFDRDREHMW